MGRQAERGSSSIASNSCNPIAEAYVYGDQAGTDTHDCSIAANLPSVHPTEARSMSWDQHDTPESLRAEAERYDEIVAALEDLLVEVSEAPVKDSRLEELFDQVTTANPNLWNIATAFIVVEGDDGVDDVGGEDDDGGKDDDSTQPTATVTDVSKLAQGKWAPEIVDDCDAMVTLEIQRGLMPDDFTYQVGRELQDEIDEFRERAAKTRQEAAELEDADGQNS